VPDDIFTVDPKWIASFYALVASAVCILIFTYNGTEFFDAFVKTFFTVVAFYLLGIITASFINFVLINFSHKEDEGCGEASQEEESEENSEEDTNEYSEEAKAS